MTMSITHVSNAIDFISNGVLLLYKQRTKSKFRLRIKFLKEQYYCFTLSSVHSLFPFFRGEGLRVVRGSNHDRMINGKIQDSHQEVKIKSFRSEIHDLLGTVKPVQG